MSNTVKSLHNTSRYPTSLIVRGSDSLGIEVAKSLLDQGGYVILIDSEENGKSEQLRVLKKYKLLTILDFSAISILEDELRRLDYVFYLQHGVSDFSSQISTQEFLQFSNYLDTILDLSAKFEAKFLLTTSVKAHEMILASKQVDFNYNIGAIERHTIYSELEMQRYAESLVHEYQEKVGIDTRTLRLGELLGDGIDINLKSNLTKAIVQALKGREMILPGDGLESDYYIHYLDAAYGILKAQFSLNTKGNIYTLANEDDISLLSIAYKLLDLIYTAEGVGFSEDDNFLPPIKMYKPAPNLMTIGWKPRVNFERALKQTVDHIKNILLEDKTGEKKGSNINKINDKKNRITDSHNKRKQTIKDKFIGVFSKKKIQNKDKSIVGDNIVATQNLEGALSRLVAERKLQESSRKGSIILANSKFRHRVIGGKHDIHSKNKRTILTGFNNSFLEKFTFLKKITIYDFIISTFGIIAFIIIYFMVIAPVLSLSKNIFLIKLNTDSIERSMSVFKMADSKQFANNIKENTVDAQNRLNELEFIFDIIGLDDKYIEYQIFLTNLIDYSTGIEEILISLGPVNEYMEYFDPGIKYTFSSTNLLTVSNRQDFPELLSKMKYNESIMNSGIKRIEKSGPNVITEIENLPDFVVKDGNYNESIKKLDNLLLDYKNIADDYKYFPSILGANEPREILFMLKDNVRYNAGGGKIVGFIKLTVKNGAIKNIEVIKISSDDKLITYPTGLIQKVNLLSNEEIKSTNITVGDLGYLIDEKDYFEALEMYVYDQLNVEADFIIDLNLKSLEQILVSSGELEFQQVTLNMDNMLTNLNLLIPSGDTSESVRNDVLLQLFAKLLERELNSIPTEYPTLIKLFSTLHNEGDMRIYTSQPEFTGLMEDTYTFNLYDDYVSFGANIDVDTNANNRYASTNISLNVYMDSDLQTKKKFTIDSSGVFNFANTFGCIPRGTKNLSYVDVPSELVTPIFSDDRVCSIFLPNTDSKYAMKFDTVAFDYPTKNGYNYSLVVGKIPGIDSSYNVEFEFASDLEVNPMTEGYSLQENKYIYSGYFENNYLDFNFIIK